ncbi:MAG: hydrogenase maturation protease [Coriobacteriia bacterium]
MGHTLVICVGNQARGDDGVAHRVARLLGPEPGGDARLLAVTALDVTLAPDVAEAGFLIVVDAVRRAAPPAAVTALVPGKVDLGGHSLDAAGLLGVARAVYGRAPKAALVSVAAPEMSHAEGLSSVAEAAASDAAGLVRTLIDDTIAGQRA